MKKCLRGNMDADKLRDMYLSYCDSADASVPFFVQVLEFQSGLTVTIDWCPLHCVSSLSFRPSVPQKVS